MSYNDTESWFDSVTGTNDYERQSWRDSSNGGRAAGDFTGNINARLDAERAAFQGATWSGSSSQPSALEVAQAGGGYYKQGGAGSNELARLQREYNLAVKHGHPKSAARFAEQMRVYQAGVSASAGPGSTGAGKGGLPNGGAGGAGVPPSVSGTRGPGAAAVSVAPTTPVRKGTGVQLPMDAPSALMPVFAGGSQLALDRGWSNAADAEDRWGEGEFLSPTYFYSWGIAGADAWANANVTNGGPLKTQKIQEDLYNAPAVIGGWGKSIAEGFLDTRRAQRENTTRGVPWGEMSAPRPGPNGPVRTGGGF